MFKIISISNLVSGPSPQRKHTDSRFRCWLLLFWLHCGWKQSARRFSLFIRLICDTSVAGDCAVNVDNNSTKARFGWILQFAFPLISFQLFLQLFFFVCVVFFLHVLLERLPFVTSHAWSLTHLVSLAVGVIVFKVAGFHFSCKRFAYLYGVIFVCYQKKKKMCQIPSVAGERSVSPLKFPLALI